MRSALKGVCSSAFFSIDDPEAIRAAQTVEKITRSIKELAEAAHRDLSSVSRDVAKLASLGLVHVIEVSNAGHDVKKIIQPVAARIEVKADLLLE